MSATTLYRLSGLSLVLCGLLAIVGPFLQGATDPPPALVSFISFVAVLLTMLGLPGLFARQAERAGILGLISMVLIFFGLAVLDGTHNILDFAVRAALVAHPATAGLLVTVDKVVQGGLLGTLIPIWGPVSVLSFILLGIVTLRAKLFPRWVGIVLIIAGPVPLIALFFPLPPLLGNLAFSAGYLALACAGFVLLTSKNVSIRQAEPVSMSQTL